MASLLDFVNRVRTLQDLPEMPWVQVSGTDPDSETACILAAAIGVPVSCNDSDEYVMVFGDRLIARRVGVVMGLEWAADPPSVKLPDDLVDLCVAEHFGLVESDEMGLLKLWWVPQGPDDGDLWPLTPGDRLFGDRGIVPGV